MLSDVAIPLPERKVETDHPHILACVQARMGSTRLPGKVLKKILGREVLWWMVERIKAAKSVSRVMVITSTAPSDDLIERFCHQNQIPCYRGSETDLLDRHYQAAKAEGADLVLKIPSDSPLTDHELMDDMVRFWLKEKKNFDFVTNINPGTFPDGLDVEACSFEALEYAWKNANKEYQREHTFPYVWENAHKFKIKNFYNTKYLGSNMFMSHRWTLDYQEDFEFIERVFTELKDNPLFVMEDVLELLKQKPEISAINQKHAGVNWYRHHTAELNIPRYMYKTSETIKLDNSRQLLEKASKVIPLGCHTLSKSTMQWSVGATPLYIDSARGCEVTDVDGNKYIDYGMALGPFILGYCDPDINAAVSRQLEKGTMFTLSSPIEAEAAQAVINVVPCAEMVRFGKNGSDVTTMAVKLARAATKKDKVVICGYHGWQDWYIASTERNAGIPKSYSDLVISTKYNDINDLKSILKAYEGEIACLIMEPVGAVSPVTGYLEEVRKLTREMGIVLIFDELFTGFRWSMGGAQEYFGVIPDLACFGKAIANGMPVSCLAGKRELMQHMETVFFSGTYLAETLSLAAVITTIGKLRDKKVHQHITTMGQYLITGFDELVKKHQLEEVVSIIGYPFKSVINFTEGECYTSSQLKMYFQQECAQRGVLFIGYHLVSMSHTQKHIDFTLKVYDQILENLREILLLGTLKNHLIGEPITPVFKNVGDRSSYDTNKG